MIELRNISYAYRRGHDIVSELSMTVRSGSICGLLGRNGVGKSTMLYLMAGLLRPRTGSIYCNGFVPFERNVKFLQDIYIVPEDDLYLPAISLNEYKQVNSVFYPKFSDELFEKMLVTFELDPSINLGALSMGQKKKAVLCFALACNTSILLLDEPTNGLDITAKRAFRKAMSIIMDDQKTIIISTHQVHDVEQILDHVIIADNNEILLNAGMMEISDKLRFNLTNNPDRVSKALYSVPVPGGNAIVESAQTCPDETEVNLECLFEMTENRRDIVKTFFDKETSDYQS